MFEYLTISHDNDDPVEESDLNCWGNVGWELIAVYQTVSAHGILIYNNFIFKRKTLPAVEELAAKKDLSHNG